jgi:glycosyltransferase involved in cell wall biosynthesis
MKKALTLSIVIPVYNEERHLKACLDAIAVQTIKPNEVIVVDNNSTDRSVEIAKSYSFVTIIKEKKQGIGYARSRGFDAVKSDVIGRIDADSVIPPNWVEYATGFLENRPNQLLTGGGYFYDLSLPHFFGWFMEQISFRTNRFILGHYIAWGSNSAFKREAWNAVKKDLHNQPEIHEDIDLAIHLHKNGYQIAYHSDWKVGIDSRIKDRHKRHTQMAYLKMWPRTLRLHKLKRAWLGDLGAYIVYAAWWPAITIETAVRYLSRFKARRLR